MTLWLVTDIAIAVTLITISSSLLISRNLFKSVILFITFGIVLAIAWVRLNAPDIALVEAAIGSGLTGALFLNAIGKMEKQEHVTQPPNTS